MFIKKIVKIGQGGSKIKTKIHTHTHTEYGDRIILFFCPFMEEARLNRKADIIFGWS